MPCTLSPRALPASAGSMAISWASMKRQRGVAGAGLLGMALHGMLHPQEESVVVRTGHILAGSRPAGPACAC
eukprot:62958-Chlamydomonas_euryale.AAC.10